MRKRAALLAIPALCALLAGTVAGARLLGSTPAAGSPVIPAPLTDQSFLLLAGADGVRSLDTLTGDVLDLGGPGLVAPGSGDVISATVENSRTRVTTTTLVGITRVITQIEGALTADVVSGSGRLVALTRPRGEGATPWVPDGRRRSKIVVAPVSGRSSSSFDLAGNFQPEAFSVDDRTLFLIEYMPALAPTHYSVRRLNLATGKVSPIARLKLAAPGVMRGTGRMQILSPDGSQLYTLYTKQGANYAHGRPQSHKPGMVHAFVHVLDLKDRWAHCIDLPMPFGSGDATASAMALSPSGKRLYVTDAANGAVATIDPRGLKVLSSDRIPEAAPDNDTFAAIGLEGPLYLGSGSTVTMLDPSDMSTLGRWQAGWNVVGLQADKNTIFIAGSDSVARVSASGSVLGSWTVEGVERLLGAFARGSLA